MQIQVNTDNHIQGNDRLSMQVGAQIQQTLGRFEERITRIEVHISDENSHKGGPDDKRCVVEARLSGLQPLSVTNSAPSVYESFRGAIKKLEKLLKRTLDRLDDPKAAGTSTHFNPDDNTPPSLSERK